VLIALLLMLMLVGIGALGAAEVWSTARKREREVELLWVGDRDPMAEDVDFEPVIINNALVGVHSTSKEAPMKHARFPRRYALFAGAEDYSQWQFVFIPPNNSYRSTAPAVTPNPGALPGLSGARH
jgi:hypothetical protein